MTARPAGLGGAANELPRPLFSWDQDSETKARPFEITSLTAQLEIYMLAGRQLVPGMAIPARRPILGRRENVELELEPVVACSIR